MATTDPKTEAGCLRATIAILRMAALTPAWGYLWYRLFQLTDATSGDYAVLYVYIGLFCVFECVASVVSVALSKS